MQFLNFTKILIKLADANLQNTILIDAGLTGVNLTGANLRGADLREADLKEQILRRSRL